VSSDEIPAPRTTSELTCSTPRRETAVRARRPSAGRDGSESSGDADAAFRAGTSAMTSLPRSVFVASNAVCTLYASDHFGQVSGVKTTQSGHPTGRVGPLGLCCNEERLVPNWEAWSERHAPHPVDLLTLGQPRPVIRFMIWLRTLRTWLRAWASAKSWSPSSIAAIRP
jgi:hypothetical protein